MTLDDARVAYAVLEELRSIAGQCCDDEVISAVEVVVSALLPALLGVPR